MDEQASDQASVPVWGLMDRGDPAWKALYSLYNPDGTQGRATSLHYSLQNRQAIQRKVAARAAATAAAAATERAEQQQQKPSPKIKVAVPRFKQQPKDVPDPLAAVPRRRTGQAIKAAMDAEAQQAWGQMPLPTGRLIDEQEKQRCALLMQFKGNIPNPSHLTPGGRVKAAAARVRSIGMDAPAMSANDTAVVKMASRRAALQQQFEEVEQVSCRTWQVLEMEVSASGMRGLGRLQQEQLSAMQIEAAAKVKEMRVLDKQIRALDVQLREACSQD